MTNELAQVKKNKETNPYPTGMIDMSVHIIGSDSAVAL